MGRPPNCRLRPVVRSTPRFTSSSINMQLQPRYKLRPPILSFPMFTIINPSSSIHIKWCPHRSRLTMVLLPSSTARHVRGNGLDRMMTTRQLRTSVGWSSTCRCCHRKGIQKEHNRQSCSCLLRATLHRSAGPLFTPLHRRPYTSCHNHNIIITTTGFPLRPLSIPLNSPRR